MIFFFRFFAWLDLSSLGVSAEISPTRRNIPWPLPDTPLPLLFLQNYYVQFWLFPDLFTHVLSISFPRNKLHEDRDLSLLCTAYSSVACNGHLNIWMNEMGKERVVLRKKEKVTNWRSVMNQYNVMCSAYNPIVIYICEVEVWAVVVKIHFRRRKSKSARYGDKLLEYFWNGK